MTEWQPKQHGNYYERRAYREMRKAEITAEKAAKDVHAMTCQCCARRIFAQSGTIAHHGYERPGTGWQTASCMGAKHLPFEVARNRLGDLIVRLKSDIQTARKHIADVRAEKSSVPFFWTEYVKSNSRFASHKAISKHEYFFRAGFEQLVISINEKMQPLVDAHTVYGTEYITAKAALSPRDRAIWDKRNSGVSFDDLSNVEINSTASRLTQLKSFLREQEERFDGWKQTHSHFDKTTNKWVAL